MSAELRYTLEVEGRPPRPAPSFAPVERALRSLKPHRRPTFAILDRGDGAFLQVAGGQASAAVELHRSAARDAASAHRAFLAAPHPNYSVPVTKRFGAGTLLLQPDEILWADDVVDVFRAFYDGEDAPPCVGWREIALG